MRLGESRLNKMPYENWGMLRVGYSETAFIMKECKDDSILTTYINRYPMYWDTVL